MPKLDADGIQLGRVTLEADTLRAADCTLITTADSSYDWAWIVENSELVIDTRNATDGIVATPTQVVKL